MTPSQALHRVPFARAVALVYALVWSSAACVGDSVMAVVQAQTDEPEGLEPASRKDQPPYEPPQYFHTTAFSPQSYLMEPDRISPNPVELDLDCEDTDAVVARCSESGAPTQGWSPRVACRLQRNPEARWQSRGPGRPPVAWQDRFLCASSPWCTVGRPEADLTLNQRRYAACGSLWLLGPCGSAWRVEFDEAQREWRFVAYDSMLQRNVVTTQPARFGMRAGAGVPDGGESDELAAAYREVFLGEGVYPAILGAYCEPTLDEMACVCSYHPQGEFL